MQVCTLCAQFRSQDAFYQTQINHLAPLQIEVECNRCKTRASISLADVRRPTAIWKLEAALKCRSCKKGRYAPPVHMIKFTEEREITPYLWVHPDEDR